jgi:hypothetical protein
VGIVSPDALLAADRLGFTRDVYNLGVQACDVQAPLVCRTMPLTLIMHSGEVLQPNASTVCYHGEVCEHVRTSLPPSASFQRCRVVVARCPQLCPVRVRIDSIGGASAFLLRVLQRGRVPVVSSRLAFNPVIAELRTNTTGVVVFPGDVVEYRLWRPPLLLPSGFYSVSVRNPSVGPAAVDADGEHFWLQQPYIWLPGPWADVCDTMPASCGEGWAYREVPVKRRLLCAASKHLTAVLLLSVTGVLSRQPLRDVPTSGCDANAAIQYDCQRQRRCDHGVCRVKRAVRLPVAASAEQAQVCRRAHGSC